MVLKLYNTLSRQKDELKPIHNDWVGLYTCGPTVYNFAHIGNLRTYLFEDVLQRTLEYNDYAVRRVMNVTDVGHLTGDVDAGDDKLEKSATAQKKSVGEIAAFYTAAFFNDLEKLNIKRPDIIAPATDFIREEIALIQMLFEKGFAYNTPHAVYFDVSKFKTYGALSGQSLDEKMVGARGEVVVDDEKKNAADFALWFKLEGKFKEHLLRWPSPWGEGFPGWHVECSAIARHFLGQPFDIHTGGVDHIGTHHTNEIAQSEAAYDVPLANIWMHSEFLLIGEDRMGKSEGNFLTLADLEKKGYDPLAFRYLTLGAHYRTKLNFLWESLDAAKNGLNHLYQQVNDCYRQSLTPQDAHTASPEAAAAHYENLFLEAMDDDLNTPRALAALQETLSAYLLPADKLTLVKKFDAILGLNLKTAMNGLPEDDAGVAEKLKEYEQLRSSKQFVQSDALRKEIEGLGYVVRDTPQGPAIVKKFF